MPRDLLIGCGSQRRRLFNVNGRGEWGELVALDNVASHKPDVLFDLTSGPLPFEDNSFDELHGYEILEHIGRQGDAVTFFAQFSDYWRVLKPGGHLCATCPSWKSIWAWGDPSHTRVLSSATLTFLNQPEYTKQIGKTAMSDFRHLYRADFDVLHITEDENVFQFVLRAVKPSRVSL
jgi:SAM-dependent methyltransferase